MNLKYNLMKNLMIKTWKPLLSLLFGVAVVIFWAVPSIAGTTGARIPIGLSLHPEMCIRDSSRHSPTSSPLRSIRRWLVLR